LSQEVISGFQPLAGKKVVASLWGRYQLSAFLGIIMPTARNQHQAGLPQDKPGYDPGPACGPG